MKKIKFFIGPCVLESWELSSEVASRLKQDLAPFSDKIELIFKGSFDKANRTSVQSYRGPGVEEGLKILERVKKEFQLPTVTDFHVPEQAMEVATVVDYLQIPAFLCRQTDMIVAGAEACQKHHRTLKVKKGQFIAPHNTKTIVEKATHFLPKDRILLTERGVCFGYNNLVVDMAGFQTMKSYGVDTVYDVTHSVQLPGGEGTITGAKRDQIEVLARAAVAAGADHIFMEAHPRPSQSKSDSTSIYDLAKVKNFVANLLTLFELRSTWK